MNWTVFAGVSALAAVVWGAVYMITDWWLDRRRR
jgi:membrane protein DedA with SNARE-associated domain